MASISFYCDKSGTNIPKKTAELIKQKNQKSKKCGSHFTTTYRKLSNKIFNKIEFYTNAANFNKAKYHARMIPENESNNNASNLLKRLFLNSNIISRIIFTDVDVVLYNAIKAQFSDLQLALCIFHIKQNLKKNVCLKLQSDYANFIVEFDKYQQIKNNFIYDIQQIYDYTAVLNNLEESFIDVKECNLESLLEDIDKSSILKFWQIKYSMQF
ncbi:hypothetical protein RhiirA4_477596 [Rhizophagus irregularis]|uniref:MULE transposase domain-containing protein n=1 Tax=Rhizophagus irregularis TaxID=588596 RepID=A0A2I1HDG4_9GLOM|nr:hypothetical protein RhiirA4_477596 [Rhizophagus irregularis]